MIIERFIGKGINGYLDLDIKFNPDLTFVTGINGSGKTSALQCIVALLTKRFDYFARKPFKQVELRIKSKNRKRTYIITKSDQTLCLSSPQLVQDDLRLKLSEWDGRDVSEKDDPFEAILHFQRKLKRRRDNAILTSLGELTPPVFMGLERKHNPENFTSLLETDDFPPYRFLRTMHYKRYRRWADVSVLDSANDFGLDMVAEHVKEQQDKIRRKTISLDEKLQKDVFRTLMDGLAITLNLTDEAFQQPSHDAFSQFESVKEDLKKLAGILHLDSNDMKDKLDKTFLKFKEIHAKTQDNHKEQQADIRNNIEWWINQQNIDKLSQLARSIQERQEGIEEASKAKNQFLHTINGFLEDNNKKLAIDETGKMHVSLPSNLLNVDEHKRSIQTLSSGEGQLVILMTYLFLVADKDRRDQKSSKKQNAVFIIDEPELSLHVEWQEKFVDAVLRSSETRQVIMATHAPSIILHRSDKCVDLTRRS